MLTKLPPWAKALAFASVLTTHHVYASPIEVVHTFSGDTPPEFIMQASNGDFYATKGEQDSIVGLNRLYKDDPEDPFQTQFFNIRDIHGLMEASDETIYVSAVHAVYKIEDNVASVFYTNSNLRFFRLAEGDDGNLYGTAKTTSSPISNLVVRLTPGGILTTNYTLNPSTEGGFESEYEGSLVKGPDGAFYGTAFWGGTAESRGTIYKITEDGTFTLLHTFSGIDGDQPAGALTLGSDGNFYGTAKGGGNCGTFFKISPGGVFEKISNFSCGLARGPVGQLAEGPDGAFYGMTREGNGYRLFRITPSGTLTTVHFFHTEGDYLEPVKTLFLAEDGYIYGGGSIPHSDPNPPEPDVPFLFRFMPSATLDQPTIALQPEAQTVTLGQAIQLYTEAVGQHPLSFQWQRDGTNIVNEAEPNNWGPGTFRLLNATLADSGEYRVIVSNPVGSVTSVVAQVTVGNVTITSHPVNQTSLPGGQVTFTVSAAGSGPLSYQWKKGGNTIPDATTSALVLNNVTTNDVGTYSVVVSTGPISVTSSNATLTLLGKPTITTHPASQTIYVGSNSTLTVVASGSLPLGYQWYKNGTPLSGATGTALAIANAQISDNGTYSVVVANAAGSTPSNPALVTVQRLVSIYHGLFYETNAVRHETAGYIKVTVKGTNFSGKILLEGLGSSFSGKLAANGIGTKTITRSNLDRENLTVTFQIDHAKDQVHGTIGGTNWTAPLLADGYPFTLTYPTTNAGTYTMLLPGFDNASEGPIGFGHGAVVISTLGKLKVAYGALADGQALKSLVTISEDGTWPLYSPAYPIKVTNLLGRVRKEYKGSVLGWMTITNNAPAGTLSWIKTGWTNAVYASGFTNESDVIGSRYIYTPGTRAMNTTNALLTFTGGGLDADFSANVVLKTNVTMSATVPLTNKTGAGLTPKYGIFKGVFRHPANTNVATRYSGAILQQQNYGAGFFVHTNATGAVSLSPQ